MTVTPRPPYDRDPMLTALCIYREARGCNYQAKLGVAWTLKNRCAMAPAEGFQHDNAGNILKPFAFSSFNDNDPNVNVYPEGVSNVWTDCLRAAKCEESDPTGGATFYFSRPLESPPKTWGHVVITAIIDGLTFCAIDRNPVS